VSAISNFQRRRLKYAATINDEALGEDTAADYELQYVDIGNVDSSGKIHEIATYRFEDAPSRARRRVRDGDVIISCVRTYLQAISPIQTPPDNLIVSTGFAVVRPREGVLHADFGKYALRESRFLAEVEMRSVGVSYPAINSSDLGDIAVYLPPGQRQRAIADYLDCETERLDALVAAKERVLELLAEKRRTLVIRAVTRGLDDSVPLKDTGLEWLPQVPRHWTSTKISRLFRQDKRLGFPDLTVLSVYRDYGVIERASRDDNANRVPDDLEKYQLVEVDDLVINKMKAWQGSLGIAGLRGITSPDYVVFRPLHREDPRFLHFLLRNHRLTSVYLSMSNGIRTSQWRLEPDRFGGLGIFLPPLVEQRAIVAHIDAESAKLDAVRFATERTISLLSDRRASLIAAAVTGQIEVG
jgi:type I restriction enzyme S subunit